MHSSFGSPLSARVTTSASRLQKKCGASLNGMAMPVSPMPITQATVNPYGIGPAGGAATVRAGNTSSPQTVCAKP